MELSKLNVKELTIEEQIMINGGNKVGEFFAKVWDAIKDAWEWIKLEIYEWYAQKRIEYMEDHGYDIL